MDKKIILDESKVRKGRAVGLPYHGSKKKVSKKIIEIIKQNFGTDKKVYDIFGGGGAITAECILNDIPVHYNDINPYIVHAFIKVISCDREYIKKLIVSRDDFFRVKDKENKTVDDYLALLVNSFSNNTVDYLYSKENSEIKFNLAKDIIANHDVFKGYKKTSTYKDALSDAGMLSQLERLQQLEQLQQLQQLQQLEQLQKLQQLEQLQKLQQSSNMSENLTYSTEDYRHFSYLQGQIIYLDPPYAGTKQSGYLSDELDYEAFYDWVVEMSKKNIVLLSEYEAPDTRFEEVYEFKSARSTYSSGTSHYKTRKVERLFMVRTY